MDQNLLKRIKRRDRLARWLITAGGFSVIFCVIFILVLIAEVSLPLFKDPEAEIFAKYRVTDPLAEDEQILATGIDEYLENAFVITSAGKVRIFDNNTAELRAEVELASPGSPTALPRRIEWGGDGSRFATLWSDGALSLDRIHFKTHFDDAGVRTLRYEVTQEAVFPALEPVPQRSLARTGEGRAVRVDLLQDNRVQVLRRLTVSDLFGNESTEEISNVLDDAGDSAITALAVDTPGSNIYAGTADGRLLHWNVSEGRDAHLVEMIEAFPDRRAITALALIYGDISLAVGDEQGEVSTWFGVRETEEGERRLRLIHKLKPHVDAVATLVPSRRDKSLLSIGADGTVHYDHMTSERHLLTLSGMHPVRLVGLNSRNNGLVGIDERGEAIVWSVDNPHPEISFQTLFGKVWYESYDEPEYVWQSSSGSDDFEPKMSLTPLIFGTIKGTAYAMLFAVPLALLGAIYTSNFVRPAFRAFIKPTVEIMAAIPTVIIGFLAALWFAPILERSIVGFFLSAVLLPTFLLVGVLAWQALRKISILKRIERGWEFLTLIPVLVLAVYIALRLGPFLELSLFDGNFTLWMFQEAGVRYDPRNCIVIAFALGFAVIPIIFTIAEDSLSNVPSSLKAASLAMGASRWQTAWRVVLPSASPGIFAGTMIGFGRAIGETMIVLMATGNTAIMDWSLFNGMRPLSANIAVEIPEAPVGGTLYRVLFLSAVILFLMTFVLNTVAEIVRQRLRRKYGQF